MKMRCEVIGARPLRATGGRPDKAMVVSAAGRYLRYSGILRVMRRERTRSPTTAAAAWTSMAAIAYVTVELFRSPIDAGTTYLPYLAVGTIAAMATVLALTGRAVAARRVRTGVGASRQAGGGAADATCHQVRGSYEP